jgi:uncharacterized membrane protein YGL010W
MLTRLISGTLALLAFAVAIFVGVWVGNDLATVLLRAWAALVLFLIFGALIGWMVQLIVQEYLEKTTQQVMAQLDKPEPGPTKDSAAEVSNTGPA